MRLQPESSHTGKEHIQMMVGVLKDRQHNFSNIRLCIIHTAKMLYQGHPRQLYTKATKPPPMHPEVKAKIPLHVATVERALRKRKAIEPVLHQSSADFRLSRFTIIPLHHAVLTSPGVLANSAEHLHFSRTAPHSGL